MSWASAIPIVGKLIDGTVNIIDQVVVDKDKRNEIIGNLSKIKEEVYIQELNTKTIPWVDALHKMGRQILNVANMSILFTLVMLDIEITSPIAMLLGGPNIAYQLIKGKGKS